jgi:hypothetical protein
MPYSISYNKPYKSAKDLYVSTLFIDEGVGILCGEALQVKK